MRGCPIKLGNLIMKAILLACALASFSAPAFAEPPACPLPAVRQQATKEFVVAFQAANAALAAKDYGRVLSFTAVARPEAVSQQQKLAVTQVEVAALAGMDDKPTATRLIKESLPDPCLPEGVRANYIKKLAEWGVPAK